MKKRSLAVLLVACSATLGFAQAHKVHQPKLTPQKSGTDQLLIAVSPVDSRVVWASGTGGTYVRTTDGGRHWTAAVVPGAESLQFRDVQGVSEKEAYLLSIGNNTGDFKIYKTVDGGKNWKVEFQNQTDGAFYDCFGFWNRRRGIAHGDSINGAFPDLRTTDGQNWESIANNMPPPQQGEASFAASGTCVTTEGRDNAWIATGGAAIARILATTDGGDTWNAYDTPLVSSASAGAITVAFRDHKNGIVGGGDLDQNDPDKAATATSNDGGKTWTLTNKPPVKGAIFCLAYARGREHGDHHGDGDRTVVITAETAPNFNSGAAAWTPDEGKTWFKLKKVSGFWAVGFADPHAGWFVGNKGHIVKISFDHD